MTDQIVWYTKVCFHALPWYGGLQLIGFAAWPFLFGVMNRLPDRGYAAAKALGLIFVAYCTFLMAHGAGQGFTWETVVLSLGFLAFLSIVRLLRVLPYLAEFVRYRWRLCVAYELIFTGAFFAMVLYRASIPQITFNIADFAAEKFTDFAVLNSLLQSRQFPPHDAWLSGFTLNYYYFGHFLWAVVARLSHCGSEIAFNLGLASIFAYVLLLSASLGYNLTGKLRYGLLASFFIGLSSNLDGFLQLFGLLHELFEGNIAWQQWYLGYDFWRSSRAIENTINEFPAFSAILGDLHAHFSSLMVFLTGLVLCLQVWRGTRRERSLLRYELNNLDELIFLAIILGALYAANSWDVVVFGGILAATAWAGATSRKPIHATEGARIATFLWLFLSLVETLLLVAVLTVAGIMVLYRPFWTNFLPPNTTLAWTSAELRSSPVEFFVHWCLLLAPPTLLFGAIIRGLLRRTGFGPLPSGVTREHLIAVASAAFAFVLLLIVMGVGVVGASSAALGLIALWTLLAWRQSPLVRLVLSWLGVFAVAIVFTELAYFDDIFSGGIERINTVFKIYYGLWPLASLTAVVGLALLRRLALSAYQRRMVRLLVSLLIVLGGVYPIAGSLQRYGMSIHYPRPSDPARGLDGMRYLAHCEPDDYAAILWLRAFAKPDARLVEAPGRQYEYAGRMGTNTGRSSLGGWLYHEWGWRGNAFEIERDRRLRLAEIIYAHPSIAATARALKSERFAYVIVGQLERARYPLLDESKFERLGRIAFRRGATTIYEIDPVAVAQSTELQEEELTTSAKVARAATSTHSLSLIVSATSPTLRASPKEDASTTLSVSLTEFETTLPTDVTPETLLGDLLPGDLLNADLITRPTVTTEPEPRIERIWDSEEAQDVTSNLAKTLPETSTPDLLIVDDSATSGGLSHRPQETRLSKEEAPTSVTQ